MSPLHACRMVALFVGNAKVLVLLALSVHQVAQAEFGVKTCLPRLLVEFASRVVLRVVVFLEKVVLIRLYMWARVTLVDRCLIMTLHVRGANPLAAPIQAVRALDSDSKFGGQVCSSPISISGELGVVHQHQQVTRTLAPY